LKPSDCINEAKRLLDLRHEMAQGMRLSGSFHVEVHCREGVASRVTHGDGGSTYDNDCSQKRVDNGRPIR